MSRVIQPGATLGMLGSGQLGRMFAVAARQLGYRVHVYSPDEDSPTGQLADREFVAAYDDEDRLKEFARSVDVVSFEFENVPSATTDCLEAIVPVRPCGSILHIAQNRLREKTELQNIGLPVTPFHAVTTAQELRAGIERLGTPCVLKSAAFGYDGKGQQLIKNAEDAEQAWRDIGSCEAILEAFIEYDREISVVGVRSETGEFTHLGPFENHHENHILDTTICPANIGDDIGQQAINAARQIMTSQNVIGVLCVEFFVRQSKNLMINEIAPRPHNSGHLSIEACPSSQFEQQVRSICGLPLGDSTCHRPAAMTNLLGDVWQNGEPRWSNALAMPGVHLHLYGKSEPRVGRKMGHITATANTVEEARQRVIDARASLQNR